MFIKLTAKNGKRIDNQATIRSQIEAAGFKNVHEKIQKCPMGGWAKDPVPKEAGKFEKSQFLSAMDGYAMCVWTLWDFHHLSMLILPRYLLTKFGEPEPWVRKRFKLTLQRSARS